MVDIISDVKEKFKETGAKLEQKGFGWWKIALWVGLILFAIYWLNSLDNVSGFWKWTVFILAAIIADLIAVYSGTIPIVGDFVGGIIGAVIVFFMLSWISFPAAILLALVTFFVGFFVLGPVPLTTISFLLLKILASII